MSASDSAHIWTSLVSVATLGTSRAAPSLDTLWPTAELPMPAGPAEQALLRASAMNHLWQMSGARSAAATLAEPDPAPASDEKFVSENAAWRLGRMLTGDHRNLVPEWLRLAAKAQAVLPPHWLPVVLSELSPQELATASPVLGTRALWLSRRNPAWAGAAVSPPPSEERWLNGTLAERRAELIAERALDPAGALSWLNRTWSSDPPDARVAFIAVWLNTPGLSMADEPFLEAALDDKRKEVRVTAVECLCRLPASAHARRNTERLQPLVMLSPAGTGLLGKLKKRRLEIELPETLDKAAVRDGVSAKPPAQRKIGERAYWLMQMVAMARPAHWCERFGCDIETFLDAAVATDFGTDLLFALSEAAGRQRDVPGIMALTQRLAAWRGPQEDERAVHEALASLIEAAPQESVDTVLERLLDRIDTSRLFLALTVLGAVRVEWGATTTKRAFELLDQYARADTQSYSHTRTLLADWAHHAHVDTAGPALERMLNHLPDKSPWRNALETLSDTLRFRAALKQELLT